MSKVDYLTVDTINPPDQKFYCMSFFTKKYVKKVIDNNNDHLVEDKKESYSTDDNVLAFKIRGGFATYEAACDHAKKLQSIDQHHNVYVCDADTWNAFKVNDDNEFVSTTEEANVELNEMMKKYMENQEKAKLYHEYRKNQMIMQSIEENLSNRTSNLEETVNELKDLSGKDERKKLKEKKGTIEEQIQKLEEKKKEINEQCKLMESKLKITNNDFVKDFVKPEFINQNDSS